MVRDGFYYGVACVAVGALSFALTHWGALLIVFALLAAFFLWFFRDPQRAIPGGPGVVVSPGDGKVTAVESVTTPDGVRTRLSIFLSVFDVHVNRVPIGGTVTEVVYTKGLYLNALDAKSAVENERNRIAVTAEDGTMVAFTQVAGLLARRIVCNVRAGDRVRRGERMGMIKFGSRVDVMLPASAQVQVKIGDRVKGGASVLALIAGAETE